MVEELLKELAWKCYQYNLRFEYVPISEGVTVFNHKYELITAGWLDGIKEKELKHMHKEVDMHIESLTTIHDTEHAQAIITENKRGLTQYERKMKESGHKQSDFL